MRRRGSLRVRGEGQGVAKAGDEVMEARCAMVVRGAMVARELAPWSGGVRQASIYADMEWMSSRLGHPQVTAYRARVEVTLKLS